MINLEFWYMLPVSIAVATTAMASGIEGGTFFTPILLLLLGLPPEVAVGTGLITEVFGFASGLYAYSKKRLIDFRLGLMLLSATIPAALAGTALSALIAPEYLRLALGFGLAVLGVYFARSVGTPIQPAGLDYEPVEVDAARVLTTSGGELIALQPAAKLEGRLWSGLGALFMGMVATGLGEMNSFFLLKRARIPARVAVATSVFVVAVTAIAASGGHIVRLAHSSPEALATVGSLVLFTIPGVVIGGQIGPVIANRISQHALERGLGLLFVSIGLVLLAQVLIGG